MGMEMVCDRCRTAKRVKRYEILIRAVQQEGDPGKASATEESYSLQADLCEKDLRGLIVKSDACCNPPVVRKKAGDEEDPGSPGAVGAASS